MNSAVVLLAHGSRREEANIAVNLIADMLNEDGVCGRVNVAFLQFSNPDLTEALEDHIRAGASDIVVAPVLLFQGVHLEEDIPALLAEEKKKHPYIRIIMAGPLGADRRIADIVKDRIAEARAGAG